MKDKGYKYWHVVVSGVGFYVKAFKDHVEIQNNVFDVPDLVMENATRYDIKKCIAKCKNWKY